MATQTTVAGVAFSTPSGGRIAIPPSGDAAVPGRIHQLPSGIAFGPLAVLPEGDRPVGIDRLAFPSWNHDTPASAEGAAALTAGGLAVGAATSGQRGDDAGEAINRRGFLAGAGIALCSAVLGAPALDIDGTPGPHLELELVENPDGVTIDLVEPLDGSVVSHDVRLDGTPIDHLTTRSTAGVHVPAGRTGRVTIHASHTDVEN